MRQVSEKTKAKAEQVARAAGATVESIGYESGKLIVKYRKGNAVVEGPTVNGFTIKFQVEYISKRLDA